MSHNQNCAKNKPCDDYSCTPDIHSCTCTVSEEKHVVIDRLEHEEMGCKKCSHDTRVEEECTNHTGIFCENCSPQGEPIHSTDKQESWRERFEKHDFDPLVHTKDRKTWIEKSQVIDFISRVEQEAEERGYTRGFIKSHDYCTKQARQSTLEEKSDLKLDLRDRIKRKYGQCGLTDDLFQLIENL